MSWLIKLIGINKWWPFLAATVSGILLLLVQQSRSDAYRRGKDHAHLNAAHKTLQVQKKLQEARLHVERMDTNTVRRQLKKKWSKK